MISSIFIFLLLQGTINAKNVKDVSVTNKTQEKIETATLAGGCFWGVEELLRKFSGVISTDVGYTGGHTADPKYEDVKTGKTGHAEAVQIKFDSSKTTYKEILHFFFKLHDPTTLNQQGNDKGSQYRSVIFYHDDQQKKIAETVIDEVNKSGFWKSKLVTTVESFTKFYLAESYHQDYLQKHPDGYTCHWVRGSK